MKFFPQFFVQRAFCACHYEAPSTALCATDIQSCHYEAFSTALCASDILYLSLWCSCYSFLCYWHSVSVIMKLLSQLCVLLTFCTSHYEAPSTALCATDILLQALRNSFHRSECFSHSVPLIMKILLQFYELLISCTSYLELLPQLCVILTFCKCYCGAPSKELYATDILHLSLWSSFHSSVSFWHSVPVIMKLLLELCVLLTFVTLIMKLHPHLCVLLTFCSCFYESPSTFLCGIVILYLSLWSSFHRCVCYWQSVPVLMKFLPQLNVLLIFCACQYELSAKALCATDILFLSIWSYFHSTVCYWNSVPVIMMLLPQLYVLLTFCTCHFEPPSTAIFYRHSVSFIMKLLAQLCVLLTFWTC